MPLLLLLYAAAPAAVYALSRLVRPLPTPYGVRLPFDNTLYLWLCLMLTSLLPLSPYFLAGYVHGTGDKSRRQVLRGRASSGGGEGVPD